MASFDQDKRALHGAELAGARGRNKADEQREALEVGTALHRLALRYWSEGRPDDARRVASQAATILRAHSPGCALLPEVGSTLRELEETYPIGSSETRAPTRSWVTISLLAEGPLDVECVEGLVWVTNSDDNSLSQIDPQTAEVVKSLGGVGVAVLPAQDPAPWGSFPSTAF